MIVAIIADDIVVEVVSCRVEIRCSGERHKLDVLKLCVAQVEIDRGQDLIETGPDNARFDDP